MINASTPMKVLEETDDYYKIRIDAWIHKSHVSTDKKPVEKGVLKVESFTKENRQTGNSYDPVLGKYFRMLVFQIKFKNTGDEEIYSWEGDLIVKNKKGAVLLVMKLRSAEAELKPGESQVLPTIHEEKDFKYAKDFEYIYSLKRRDIYLELTDVFIELKP